MAHTRWYFWPDLVFHEAEAILFLFLVVLSASWVARSRARIHLRWLVPFVINDALHFAQVFAWDASSLLHIHWNAGESALYHTTGYVSGLVGVCGMFMLWRTLMAVLPARAKASAVALDETGVWPPPPAGVA